MAGAWDCYRAILRMTTHLRRRGSLDQRIDLRIATSLVELQQRLATWAADPRTTIPQLRCALEEVLKCGRGPNGIRLRLKIGYLDMMRFAGAAGPSLRPEQIGGNLPIAWATCSCRRDMLGYLDAARRFLLREPERSRRVLRLLLPTGWRTWNTPGSHGNRPFGRVLSATSTKPIEARPACRSTPSARCTGRRPRAITAGGGKLAGHDQRRQAATLW